MTVITIIVYAIMLKARLLLALKVFLRLVMKDTICASVVDTKNAIIVPWPPEEPPW